MGKVGGDTSFRFTTGLTDIEWPHHARSAILWTIIQSTVPSSLMTAKEVKGVLVEMRHVRGDVETICIIYRSGISIVSRNVFLW